MAYDEQLAVAVREVESLRAKIAEQAAEIERLKCRQRQDQERRADMSDKIREAFDATQIDPRYASYNIDSFSFHLGYQAAISSLEQVGKFQLEYMNGPVVWYQVNIDQEGEPLFRIAAPKGE